MLIPNFDAELFNFSKLEVRALGIRTFLPTLAQQEARDKLNLAAFGAAHGRRGPKLVRRTKAADERLPEAFREVSGTGERLPEAFREVSGTGERLPKAFRQISGTDERLPEAFRQPSSTDEKARNGVLALPSGPRLRHFAVPGAGDTVRPPAFANRRKAAPAPTSRLQRHQMQYPPPLRPARTVFAEPGARSVDFRTYSPRIVILFILKFLLPPSPGCLSPTLTPFPHGFYLSPSPAGFAEA